MDWDAKFVKPLSDYRVYAELENGRKGIFDVKPYLSRGALRELRDVHYFNQVGILFGAITWPNEQDIAPETLVAEMFPAGSENLPNNASTAKFQRILQTAEQQIQEGKGIPHEEFWQDLEQSQKP